jgi:hypothetical protein
MLWMPRCVYSVTEFSDALSQTRYGLLGKVAGDEFGDGIEPARNGNDLQLESRRK